MRRNTVKRKLKNGEFVFGTMLKEALNCNISEILEQAGFDFFVIDMEHACYSMPVITPILQYARKTGITSIVRVPQLDYSNVAKALDMGAEGIWVPHVDRAEEAKHLVQFAKYAPEGRRGASVPAFRTKEYQQAESPAAYFKACNDDVLLIVQIESVQAVANVEQIVSINGIDVAMIGTQDLSLDMGYPGQGAHPEVKKSIQRIVDACKKYDVASGNHIGNIDELRYWMEQGMRMITYTHETNLMIERGKEALKALREGFLAS